MLTVDVEGVPAEKAQGLLCISGCVCGERASSLYGNRWGIHEVGGGGQAMYESLGVWGKGTNNRRLGKKRGGGGGVAGRRGARG